jgi:hypothetical protein
LHLGKRVKHVEILNEKDCIKVKPKGWLDKQIWKEINYILRLHQFAWLSTESIALEFPLAESKSVIGYFKCCPMGLYMIL